MHLKEGVRGYFKSQSAKRGSERFSAPEVSDFRPQYRISQLGLDIVPERNDFGQFLFFSSIHRFSSGRISEAVTRTAIIFPPSPTRPSTWRRLPFRVFFIIDGNPYFSINRRANRSRRLFFFFLDSTGGNRYDVMASLPVAAERRFPLYETCRYGHFISVRERMRRRKHRPHQISRFAGDTLYHIFYTAVFHIELPFIGEMGKLAAAAVFINGTLRHHAERRFLLYGKQFPQGIRFFSTE